jgi:hypothetical protein
MAFLPARIVVADALLLHIVGVVTDILSQRDAIAADASHPTFRIDDVTEPVT